MPEPVDPQAAQPTPAPEPPAPSAAAPPPAQPPAALPAPPEPPAVPAADSGGEPAWLPERLERAKQSAWKEAGFTSLEEAKKAQGVYAAQEEAKKTSDQKAADAQAEATRLQKENESLTTTITNRCDAELTRLTDEQRAAVIAIAGDDANVRLRTIDALTPTWAKAPEPAPADPAAAAPPAAPPPVAAPASSMPATGGPPPTPPTGEENHLAVWGDLKETNPLRAARYYAMHQQSIVQAQRASG